MKITYVKTFYLTYERASRYYDHFKREYKEQTQEHCSVILKCAQRSEPQALEWRLCSKELRRKRRAEFQTGEDYFQALKPSRTCGWDFKIASGW